MTDDLVKLLREWAVNYQCNSEWKIVWEAADRIEAQDKRNKELEAALREITKKLENGCHVSEVQFAFNIARAALGEKKDD